MLQTEVISIGRINTRAQLLDEQFATRTMEEWKVRLATMEGPWATVQTALEVFGDPQVSANGYLQEVTSGDRTFHVVSNPVQFDETVAEVTAAPSVGRDTEAVLLELGLDWDEILRHKVADDIL